MHSELPNIPKETVEQQRQGWSNAFLNNPDAFGEGPSQAAKKAADLFKKEGKTNILELGGGGGRDTIFLAQGGFKVQVLDFSQVAVDLIIRKARDLELSESITALCHDVRNPFPFEDQTFDACYSFGLYCGALLTSELEFLSSEIRRILTPGGLNIYTVRNTNDPHYGTGTNHGGDMYQVGSFIVHFFSKEKVTLLSKGYELISVDEFEEGLLPRRLYGVTMRKN